MVVNALKRTHNTHNPAHTNPRTKIKKSVKEAKTVVDRLQKTESRNLTYKTYMPDAYHTIPERYTVSDAQSKNHNIKHTYGAFAQSLLPHTPSHKPL